jgi:hypothetical protein
LTSSPGPQGLDMQGVPSMIQLATDPQASRLNWRPTAAEAQAKNLAQRRSGHAWPFISRHSERPVSQQGAKRTPNSESGS